MEDRKAMTRKDPKGIAIYTTTDVGDQTFFGAFTDVFTPPEDLPLHYVECGYEARLGDAMRIRQDIEKAVQSLGLEQRHVA